MGQVIKFPNRRLEDFNERKRRAAEAGTPWSPSFEAMERLYRGLNRAAFREDPAQPDGDDAA